ncbi:trimeric autotransporter adhesin, partial [Mycetohabitans endofungorum]
RKESRWDKKPSDMQAMSMSDAASYGEGSSQPKVRKESRWDKKPSDMQDMSMDDAASYGEGSSQPKVRKESRWDKKPSDMQDMSMDDASSHGEGSSQPKVRKESRWDKKPSDMQAMSMDDASSHGEGSGQPKIRKESRWDKKPSDMQDMSMDDAASYGEGSSQPKIRKESRWDKKPSDMQDMSMDDAASYGEGSSQPKIRKESRWDKKPSDMQAMSMDDAASYGEGSGQPKVRKESRWDVKPSTLGSDTQDKLTPRRELKQRLDVTTGTPTDIGVQREKRRRERSQSVPISLPSEPSPREADRLVKRKRPTNELLSVIDLQNDNVKPGGPQKDAANQIDAGGLHPSHTGKDHADDSHVLSPSMQGANRVRQRSRSLPVLAPGLEQRRLQADTPLFVPVHTFDDGNPDGVQQVGAHELAWHQSSFTNVPPITVSGIDVNVVDNKVAVLHDASGNTHTPILGTNSSAFENGSKGQWTLAPYEPVKPYIVDRDGDGWRSGPAPSRGMKPSTLGSDTQDKLTPRRELKQRLDVTTGTPTDVGVQREKRRRERSQSVPISLPSEPSPREADRLVKRKRPTNELLSVIDLQNDNVKPGGPQKDAANQIDAGGLHPSHTGKDHADDSHVLSPSMQGANRVRQRSRSLPVLAPGLEQRRLQADTPLFVPVHTFDDGNPDGVQQVGAHELAWHQSSFTNVPPITVSGIDVNVVDNKVAVLHDASGNTHTPILGTNSSAFENGSKGQWTLAPYEPVKPYIVDRDGDGWRSGPAPSREMEVGQAPAEHPALPRSSTSTMSDAGADSVSVSQAAVMAKTDNENQSQVGESNPEPVASNSSSVSNSVQADQHTNAESTKIQAPETSSSLAVQQTAAEKVRDAAPGNRGRSKSAVLLHQQLQVAKRLRSSSEDRHRSDGLDAAGLEGGIWQSGPAPSREMEVGQVLSEHPALPRSSASTMSDAGASVDSKPTQFAGETRMQLQALEASLSPTLTAVGKMQDVAPGNRGGSDEAESPQQEQPAGHEASATMLVHSASRRGSASTMSDAGASVDSKPTQFAEETHTQLQALEASLSPTLTVVGKMQDVAPGNRGGSDGVELSQQAQPTEPVASATTLAHPASRRSSMSTMSDAGASIDSRSTQSADEIRTQLLAQTPEASLSPALTAADKMQDVALGNRGGSDSAELPQQAQPTEPVASVTMLAHSASHRSSASTMSDAGASIGSRSTQSADETRTQPLVQPPEASSSLAVQQTAAEKVRDAAPGNRGRSKSAVLLHQQPQVAKRLRSSSEDRRRPDGLDAAGLEGGIWQSGPAPSREMETAQAIESLVHQEWPTEHDASATMLAHPASRRGSASTMSDAGASVDSKPTQFAGETRMQLQALEASLSPTLTAVGKMQDVAPGNRGGSDEAESPQQEQPAGHEASATMLVHSASRRGSASTMSDAGASVDSKPTQFAGETRMQLQALEASLSPALTAADKVQGVAPGNRGGSDGVESPQQEQSAGHEASATTSAHPASRRSSTSTMSDAGASIDSRSTQSADEIRTQLLAQTPEASLSPALTAADKMQDVALGNRGGSDSAELPQQAQPTEPVASVTMLAHSASHRNSTSTMSDADTDSVSVSQAAVMAKTDDENQSQVGESNPEPVASNSSSVSNSVQADQHTNAESTKMTSLTRPGPSTTAATSRDAAPEQDVLHGWLREAIAAELPSVMTEQLGISVDETRVSVGTPGQERKITHVARGTEPTDAVNKAQLDEAVARVDRDASAGIAAAMAVAGLPQPTLPGKSLAAFAGATYRGQYGAALGISHVTPNNRWVFKLAANANGRGYFGAVASGGFQW